MNIMTDAEYEGFKRGKREGMLEGERKGKREGKLEGKREAKITMLKYLLQAKFGTIPPRYHKQIAQAQSDNLLPWIKRVLNSQSLKEVFNKK